MGTANAQERLVMPFACTNHGGHVSLTKSAPQTYRIYGQREHQRLTTCSPYDSRNCHTWFVHRFDLDCGGVRTSWHAVVAALSRTVSERLGTGHGSAGRGPGGGVPSWAYGPRGPGVHGAGPVIDFPPGFAPNPMKIARFERTEIALAPLPPKKPAQPRHSQIAGLEPDQEPDAVSSHADPQENPEEAIERGTKESAADEAVTKDAAEPKPVAERTLVIETVDQGADATGSLPAASTLWRDAGVVFAMTFAALLALTAILLLRRRRLETEPVEIVTVPVTGLPQERSFGSGLQTRAAFLTNIFGRETVESEVHDGETRKDEAHRTEAHRAEARDIAPTRLRLWDEDWLPTTMSEALDVLGVDPSAGRDMIKTTVTRLRRALHPDHALDEEDRLLRERRLKQINVAWDIVSGKRRALWLSVKPS